MIEIHIPGQPVAKGRARSTASGHHYTPKRTRDWEKAAKAWALVAMRQAGQFRPLEGPLFVFVYAVFEPPKSWSKAQKAAALNGYHTGKPDADNLAKAALDACNGVVWVDDAQVVCLSAEKCYGAEACVKINVRWPE